MKLLYYCAAGMDSGFVLMNDSDVQCFSSGYYYFKDILNREYRIPIVNSFTWIEDFDGDESRLSQRYKTALKEMRGIETGKLGKK
jgi:hypothetical protein